MTDNKHVRNISIQGFKSIKELDLELSPINILIGANGAGKSNFISLFNFLRHLSEGKLQKYIEAHGYADSFFHFGSKNTKEILIEIDIDINGYHVTFEHGVHDDNLIFREEYCTITSSNAKYYIKGSKKGESGILPGGDADSERVRNYTRGYMEKCRVYHFHDTSSTAGFKKASNVNASDYLYPNAENLAAFLYRLKNSKRKKHRKSYLDIVDTIQVVAPYFHDFYLEPRGEEGNESVLLKWLHRDHDNPFSANQLSDGTARFICMATLFLQPKELRPATIVIDEPELGLHPAALEVLSEIVKSVSETNQVICSTQSITFANHFEAKDFVVVDIIDGASTFKRVEESELEGWLNEFDMGDIWNKNLIGGRPSW